MSDSLPLPPLPRRDPRGHKGTFGAVMVVGGCAEHAHRMIGAPALAGLGALRGGAGLVRFASPEPILNNIISLCPAGTGTAIPVDSQGQIVPHEAAAVLDSEITRAQAVVLGPGLGTSEGARSASLRCVQQEEVPVIVDADGLNCLAGIPELWRDFRAAAVLTPHPGEYRRLAEALNISADPVRNEMRPAAAELLAQRLGCVIVLKGAGTVVTDGLRTWISDASDAVLATGGTGDVLSGLIAGLVAQFVGPPLPPLMRQSSAASSKPLDLFDAARLGVHIHAKAGANWASRESAQSGMAPSELADSIPGVMNELWKSA